MTTRAVLPLSVLLSAILVAGCVGEETGGNSDASSPDNTSADNVSTDYGSSDQVFPGGAVRWSQQFANATAQSNVVIPSDMKVVMDVSAATIRSLTINGALLFEDRDIHLQSDWIRVDGPDALLQLGTSDNPLASNVRITLTDPRYVYREHVALDPAATGHSNGQILWHVAANGSKEAQLGFGNYKGLMVMGGATLSIYGESAKKTSWTQLARAAEPRDTQLELVADTGWEAGDRITLAPTGMIAEEAEDFTITAVNGRTVFLDKPVQHLHLASQQTYNDARGQSRTLDMRAEVGLLSRNIVIEGDERSKERNYGAHTMFMYPSTVNISGLELRNCGQQGSQGRYCSHWHRPYVDNMEAIYQKPAFQALWARALENTHPGHRARDFPGYPGFPDNNLDRWVTYTHQMYSRLPEAQAQLDQFLIESIDATGDYIRNSSIHTSFQRAVNLHGVKGVVVDNNVGYNISNHAFVFSEDGGEHGNTMTNNLAVLVKNVLDREKHAFLKDRLVLPSDLNDTYAPCFEAASRHITTPQSPSCQEENKVGAFWGENPFNTLTGNVAAGVTNLGNGFFYSAAFARRAYWDEDRGLYLMGGAMTRDARGTSAPTIGPVPIVFENNRAHTISAKDSSVSGGVNTYPPSITGAGFFFRTFLNSPSDKEAQATLVDLQGYGFQDHGIWFENGQTVDGCILASGQKRLLLPHGQSHSDASHPGATNCVLIGNTGEPSHALTGIGDSSRAFNNTLHHFAYGPNFGRAPETFSPFLRNTVIYGHVGGVLTEDTNKGTSVDMMNVTIID